MWYLLALSSGFFAALWATIVKMHLKNINVYFVVFLFSIISALLLVVFQLFTHKIDYSLITTLTAKEWLFLILAGALNGIGLIFFLTALQYGYAGAAVALDRLGIIFAVILAALFLQEAFTIKTVIGAVLMVVGAAFISM